ncbi:hypothetical protein Bbelb_401430 [Branchiostoma belcheri]|nr:hypothetical protein Bbelb_401430 [Branchiostoma belcheri]
MEERRLQPGEEGGCPFRHFDTKHLQKLLNTEGVTADVQNQLVDMAMDQKPREACKTYLFHKLERSHIRDLLHRNCETQTCAPPVRSLTNQARLSINSNEAGVERTRDTSDAIRAMARDQKTTGLH